MRFDVRSAEASWCRCVVVRREEVKVQYGRRSQNNRRPFHSDDPSHITSPATKPDGISFHAQSHSNLPLRAQQYENIVSSSSSNKPASPLLERKSTATIKRRPPNNPRDPHRSLFAPKGAPCHPFQSLPDARQMLGLSGNPRESYLLMKKRSRQQQQ